MVSDGDTSNETLVLLWVWVMGLSIGYAVTAWMGMLAAAALLLGTSTSLDRQYTAPDIHSKVILYVANSSDQCVFFVISIFSIKELLQGLVVIV